jgi:ribulose-5-phosphate 4-epimerase/fuculose-1-phosphate aldolase
MLAVSGMDKALRLQWDPPFILPLAFEEQFMPLIRCACYAGFSYWTGAAAGPPDALRSASEPPASGGPVDPSIFEEIASASRILAVQGVLDAFGHVSMRHPTAPDRFLMSRSLAPALVTAGDIMEFNLDGEACDPQGRGVFLERFIHGAIYRARADVASVVHSHSPSVIPFGLVETPMRAMYHNAAFLAEGVPVFDIAEEFGATDMLVGSWQKGAALARSLGDKSVVLMRGHGSVAVGPSLEAAVFRAIMTETNAKLQSQATILSQGGPIAALSPEEGRLADAVNLRVIQRPWELWKRSISGRS